MNSTNIGLVLLFVVVSVYSQRAPYRPCPFGWTEDGSGIVCYKAYEPGRKTFQESRDFCQEQNPDADLAVLRSTADVTVASDMIRANTWLNLQKDGLGKSFSWVTEPFNKFYYWGLNQPNAGQSITCGYLFKPGEYIADMECDEDWPVTLCELQSTTSLSPTVCGCPPAYEHSFSDPSWCFRPVLTNQFNFSMASAICADEGHENSALATLRGDQDRKQVSDFIAADVWVGLSYSLSDHWKWFDESVKYVIPWGRQQPNAESPEIHCGALFQGDKMAADYPCSDTKYFVCEARSTCTPPSVAPTSAPSSSPTVSPTRSPTFFGQTRSPTASPTHSPSSSPTAAPTSFPSKSPTAAPTFSPVAAPTQAPTASPTASPVASPTASPVAFPTASPVASPTASPVASPTSSPVASPTAAPSPVDFEDQLIEYEGMYEGEYEVDYQDGEYDVTFYPDLPDTKEFEDFQVEFNQLFSPDDD